MQMVEKERLVLQKIYDLGGPTHTDWVPIDKLSKELGMPFRELNGILLDFERKKGWVEGPDEAVGLTPAGVREVENPGGDTGGGGATIQNIFHAPVQGGFIQGGHGHTQQNVYSECICDQRKLLSTYNKAAAKHDRKSREPFALWSASIINAIKSGKQTESNKTSASAIWPQVISFGNRPATHPRRHWCDFNASLTAAF